MGSEAISIAALECFANVAREGSFAAVARKRHIDASIVSRTIAGLEAQLGFRLFDRTTRRLNLTEAGTIFLERSQALVSDLDAARLEAIDAISTPSGLVRITASTAFGVQWLTPRLRGFMQEFPQMSVEAILTDSVVDIAAERIDLALRLSVWPEGDLIATKLMSTRYHAVASPDYIASAEELSCPEELADRDCLLMTLPGYRSSWSFRNGAETIRVGVKGRLCMSSPAAIRAAAMDGMGPALLANWMVTHDLRSGTLVDLFPDWEAGAASFDTSAWILYPSRDYLPNKVRVLIDYLKASVDPAAR